MDRGWRLLQIEHDRESREVLAKAGSRFRDWVVVMMFYEVVITLDGCAEARGMPAPQGHKARRSVVGRHLPHPAEQYNALYALSLAARYYDGYAVTENEGRRAARCHETLLRNIPVQ